MAAPTGKVPIVESAGEAVRFLREHWRLALAVGAAAGVAQGATMIVIGPTLVGFLALGLIAAMAHAAYLQRATGAGAGAPLALDALRVFAAMAAVVVILFVVCFAVAYGAMVALIAPFAEEAQTIAEAENQEQMMALLNRAIESQPHVLYIALGIGAVLALLLTSRLYLAAPATVARKRIVIFESWRLTKGNMWRISAARILVLAPAMIVVGAAQSLIGMGMGLNVGDAAALAGQAQAAPGLFAAFYGLAGAVQVAVFGALEAGLAAYLYKGLKPAEAPVVA
jgi:hypothetical protein